MSDPPGYLLVCLLACLLTIILFLLFMYVTSMLIIMIMLFSHSKAAKQCVHFVTATITVLPCVCCHNEQGLMSAKGQTLSQKLQALVLQAAYQDSYCLL